MMARAGQGVDASTDYASVASGEAPRSSDRRSSSKRKGRHPNGSSSNETEKGGHGGRAEEDESSLVWKVQVRELYHAKRTAHCMLPIAGHAHGVARSQNWRQADQGSNLCETACLLQVVGLQLAMLSSARQGTAQFAADLLTASQSAQSESVTLEVRALCDRHVVGGLQRRGLSTCHRCNMRNV